MKLKKVLLVLTLLAFLLALAGGYLCHSLTGSILDLSASFLIMALVIFLYLTGKEAIVREIDESRRAEEGKEEALRESEKQYRNFVDNALVGIYKTDLEGNVLYANEALIKMLEFESYEDMKSVGVLARNSNLDDGDTFIKKIKELKKEGMAREIVHRIQTMRRSANFDIADHIVIYYQGDDYSSNQTRAFIEFFPWS